MICWQPADNESNITLTKHQTIGFNVTTLAFERNKNYQFIVNGTKYSETPTTPLPSEVQTLLRRGFYAAVSFMDYEVGRILSELDELGLSNDTAVIFHSDHGWKLGEHGDWSKAGNWELDARVPLLIRAPWLQGTQGKRTRALAELVDLFPTAVELAGLPPVPLSEGLEGSSLVPILQVIVL